jgi:hypothetical protein
MFTIDIKNINKIFDKKLIQQIKVVATEEAAKCLEANKEFTSRIINITKIDDTVTYDVEVSNTGMVLIDEVITTLENIFKGKNMFFDVSFNKPTGNAPLTINCMIK